MTENPVLELSTYFGPDDESVFGTLHMPASGRVHGTVLICAPLAKEQFDSVRGLRLLANALAAKGLAVLRFDYYGTGDSAWWAERDDIVAKWLASLRHAVAYLRDLVGTDPALIGLRAGALLAAAAMRSIGPLGPVVFWDPVGRGQSFFREQAALYKMTVGEGQSDGSAPDEIPLIGTTFTTAARADLAAMRIEPQIHPLATRWLVATRPGSTDRAVEALTEAAAADRCVVDGMPEFVQPADYLVQVPKEAIDHIVGWVDTALAGLAEATIEPVLRSTAIHQIPSGARVVELIERLGPHELFTIRSLPVEESASMTALFCTTANDTHHGPNRAWVDIARAVAANGGQGVRFDRRGVGETGPVTADESPRPYSRYAKVDALTAATACGPPEQLLVTGVCSGAWQSAQIGRRMKPGALVLVNSIVYSWRHKTPMPWARRPDALGGVPRSDPAFARSPLGRIKAFIQHWLPYSGWRLLGRAGITQVPEVLLRPLVNDGIDVTLVLSPHDAGWFDGQRGTEGVRRLHSKNVRIVRTGIGDHTAYHPCIRAATAAAVLKWSARDRHQVGEQSTTRAAGLSRHGIVR